jgi:hypothetical protein
MVQISCKTGFLPFFSLNVMINRFFTTDRVTYGKNIKEIIPDQLKIYFYKSCICKKLYFIFVIYKILIYGDKII